MEFAHAVADHVIFMADGVIAESGTPEAVFSSERVKGFIGALSNKV